MILYNDRSKPPMYCIATVRKDPNIFGDHRVSLLPKEKYNGINDIDFVHPKLFIGAALSLQGAKMMAQ